MNLWLRVRFDFNMLNVIVVALFAFQLDILHASLRCFIGSSLSLVALDFTKFVEYISHFSFIIKSQII